MTEPSSDPAADYDRMEASLKETIRKGDERWAECVGKIANSECMTRIKTLPILAGDKERQRRRIRFFERQLANQRRYLDAATWVCLAGPIVTPLFYLLGLRPNWLWLPAGFAVAFLIGAIIVMLADDGKSTENRP